MKNLKIGLILLSAIATTVFLTPTSAFATQQPDPHEDKDKGKSQPFSGKVDAVDTTAKTMTVDSKLIYISSDTKLTAKDKAITLSDVKAGDAVSGTTHTTFDGKTEALTVKVTGKAPAKDKEKY